MYFEYTYINMYVYADIFFRKVNYDTKKMQSVMEYKTCKYLVIVRRLSLPHLLSPPPHHHSLRNSRAKIKVIRITERMKIQDTNRLQYDRNECFIKLSKSDEEIFNSFNIKNTIYLNIFSVILFIFFFLLL